MTYEIRWDKKAREFLQKQDKALAQRIVNKVGEVANDPSFYLEPLTKIKAYKLRVGDYRIIIYADWGHKTLFILLIDHRKRIYKTIK